MQIMYNVRLNFFLIFKRFQTSVKLYFLLVIFEIIFFSESVAALSKMYMLFLILKVFWNSHTYMYYTITK